MTLIRRHHVGDIGWLLMRQAELYAQEHGYSPVFEAYVARGLPAFMDGFDHRLDVLLIAEQDGVRVGAVAIQHSADRSGWAQLRWYFVEPDMRGAGIGSRLLDEAMGFAGQAGHQGIYLWTVDDLDAARRQYERAGFRLAAEDPECPWKPGQVQQRWELTLAPQA